MGALRLTRQDRMSEQMNDFAKELSALVMAHGVEISVESDYGHESLVITQGNETVRLYGEIDGKDDFEVISVEVSE